MQQPPNEMPMGQSPHQMPMGQTPHQMPMGEWPQQMPTNQEPQHTHAFKEARLAARIPILSRLLSRIDSRELFSSALSKVLRFVAHIGVATILLVWLRSLPLIGDVRSGAPIVTAILVQLLALQTVIFFWGLIIARADTIASSPTSNVITVMLRLWTLLGEVFALTATVTCALFGVAHILAGPDGDEAFALGLVMLPAKSWQELFGGSGGKGAVEFSSRLNGLGLLLMSVVVGFLVLLVYYVVSDVYKLIYEFLLRKEKETP